MKGNQRLLFLIFILFMILDQSFVLSQVNVIDNQSKTFLLKLKDGTAVKGKIVSENTLEVIVATGNIGTVTIRKDQIESSVPLDNSNFKNGKYWFPDPNYSRYFIGPGIQLKKGDGYYQNIDLSINTVSYGITNFFSIGGGLELYSTLSGHPIFLLMPKLGFKVDKSVWVGAGILYLNAPEVFADFRGVGIAYGSATFGNENNNVSVGAGWGFIGTVWSKNPVIALSGMTRVCRKLALISENWFIPGNLILSYGVRFMGEKISVDLGLVNSKEIVKSFPIGVPLFLDFVLKF